MKRCWALVERWQAILKYEDRESRTPLEALSDFLKAGVLVCKEVGRVDVSIFV